MWSVELYQGFGVTPCLHLQDIRVRLAGDESTGIRKGVNETGSRAGQWETVAPKRTGPDISEEKRRDNTIWAGK